MFENNISSQVFQATRIWFSCNIQLHHFSDASEYGYGAVSYLQIVNDKVVPHCSFVLGKSCTTS